MPFEAAGFTPGGGQSDTVDNDAMKGDTCFNYTLTPQGGLGQLSATVVTLKSAQKAHDILAPVSTAEVIRKARQEGRVKDVTGLGDEAQLSWGGNFVQAYARFGSSVVQLQIAQPSSEELAEIAMLQVRRLAALHGLA